MARSLPQLISFFEYVLTRTRRELGDEHAARDVAWTENDLPAGLELEWLGTSGFRITYEGTTVLVDPYLTRFPMRDFLRRRAVPPDSGAIDRVVSAADAVLVGHTHFDHALDVPAIAKRHGATVYGSRSMANLMALYQLRDHMVEVDLHRTYDVGPFAITFVPSVHSKLVLGVRVPYCYDITCEHFDGLSPAAYGCGQVYGIHIAVAGVTFYHQGSADLIDDAIRHRGVDYFLAGIAGRGFTRDYARRILRRLEPRVVVPHHYDDFFRPLEAPMKFSLNVGFERFLDEVGAVSRDFEIRALTPLQPVRGREAP